MCQVVISWPYRENFTWDGHGQGPLEFPSTTEASVELIKAFAETWTEPFRSIAQGVSSSSDLKQLELSDFVPPENLRTTGRVVLMGDALHAMTICT